MLPRLGIFRFPIWESSVVEVLSFKLLEKYWKRKGNEKAEKPLRDWFGIAEHSEWKTTIEVKNTFPQTDFQPRGRAIFDIGGNKFRIVARIEYQNQIVRIEEVLDHTEYDAWNEKQRRQGK
ncbi:type II toxin-antitoxin system HigB family toxin [Roseomonas nepalensis]|uniref:Type II toxin-antitoxin system HigB family toxin n=1 Tax=Muricoccus nepalensis TaxID=1854500 RepID=A0A502F9B4_9PROT|nr:type II toxin-antitoxin system HigB family toxin [Roseomonas nepalensis]